MLGWCRNGIIFSPNLNTAIQEEDDMNGSDLDEDDEDEEFAHRTKKKKKGMLSCSLTSHLFGKS